MAGPVPGGVVDLESAFLHGAPSQVLFPMNGETVQCELADMAFVAALVTPGRPTLFRTCFVQTKGGFSRRTPTGPPSFKVDHKQLFLLRTFPAFEGVPSAVSVIPAGKHILPNITGMLGAMGFLSSPGEMSLLSAQRAYLATGGRGTIRGEAIASMPIDGPWSYPFWTWGVSLGAWNHPMWNRRWDAAFPLSVTSCLGIEDVSRAWGLFALGELSVVWRTMSPGPLDGLLRAISDSTPDLGKLKGALDSGEPPEATPPEPPPSRPPNRRSYTVDPEAIEELIGKPPREPPPPNQGSSDQGKERGLGVFALTIRLEA